jgi:hypothetical protein
MSKQGCSYVDNHCLPTIESCQGCSRTVNWQEGVYCAVAPDPKARWSRGSCNMATHVERKIVEQSQKINPLKASKRAAAGKGKK